jgi:hypothetical protein
MAIRVRHGDIRDIAELGVLAGKAQAAQREIDYAQAMARQARQMQHEKEMTTFRAKLDIEAEKRAQMWEFEKMEIRSRLDFEREERERQQKLDEINSVIRQLDKEVLAGRLSEKDIYSTKLRLELAKTGINIPATAFQTGRYGVEPYWRQFKEYPEVTPERQLYETKMKEEIEGGPSGTIPYYLDPTFVRENPAVARQAQEARNIFLTDEEFGNLISGAAPTVPTVPTAPAEIPTMPTAAMPLDETTARQILREAGGNKDLARQIARLRGYSL